MHPHLIVEDISDHLPILIVLKDLNKSVRGSNLIKSRNLNTSNLEKIGGDIKRHDWQKLLSKSNASQGFSIFHKILCDTIAKHAPETVKRISVKKIIKNPWITSGIMKSLSKQRQMFKAHLKGDVSTFNYRKYRNNLQRIIRFSKRRYLHEKCSEYRRDSKNSGD